MKFADAITAAQVDMETNHAFDPRYWESVGQAIFRVSPDTPADELSDWYSSPSSLSVHDRNTISQWSELEKGFFNSLFRDDPERVISITVPDRITHHGGFNFGRGIVDGNFVLVGNFDRVGQDSMRSIFGISGNVGALGAGSVECVATVDGRVSYLGSNAVNGTFKANGGARRVGGYADGSQYEVHGNVGILLDGAQNSHAEIFGDVLHTILRRAINSSALIHGEARDSVMQDASGCEVSAEKFRHPDGRTTARRRLGPRQPNVLNTIER